MKKIWIILICLFVMAPGPYPAAAKGCAGGDSTRYACLKIISEQQDLPIYLDGTLIGKTPLESTAIETGHHELVVESKYWPSWEHPNYVTDFFAAPGQTVAFHAAFQEQILVNSLPYKADVFVNGKYMGTTPITMTRDTAKEQKLEISKNGYEAYQIRLVNVSGTSLLANLVPRQEWLLERNAVSNAKKNRVRRNWRLMFASLGFAAAAGLATVHFRSKGNDAYTKYQQAVVPDRMDHFFKQAEQYDQIAGWSYAMFEIGFVLTGYYFLASRKP